MKKIIILFLIIIVSVLILNCNDKQQEKPKVNKKNEYGEININAPKELIEFGQLVGEWKCDISNLSRDSTWVNSTASWVFKYILDGHAIQDYWINPAVSTNDSISQLLGSNIRIYNPEMKKWQCIWIENRRYQMRGIWYAKMNSKNEIIVNDSLENWTIKFFDISKNKFNWKWEYKQPDGSMKIVSKMVAIRKK